MEMFPIHFKKDSFENWNRQTREFDLLQNIFTENNFSTFTTYSSFMIKSFTTFNDCNSSAVQEFVRLGDEFFDSREFRKAIEKYSEALNKPFNQQKKTCALLMKRALCYEELNQLEKSIGDLENAHELEDIEPSELKLQVRLRLLQAYETIGHKNNFHAILEEAVHYMKVTKFEEKSDQKEVEGLIKQSRVFIKGYRTCQSISVSMKNAIRLQTKTKEVTTDLKPFQGYSPNPKMTGASIACSLIESKTTHKTKVLANRPIKKSEIVVLDRPFVSEISSPLCEYCHDSNSTFFCYKCGYVSYCSNECKIRDHNFHKYECIGYNFFWLNILKVKIELRTLIRCLGFMKKAIFDKFDLSSIRSAEDLVKLLEHHLELNGHFEYSNVYNMDPKYDVMSLSDYKSCAMKSLFLTSYIEKHTTMIKDFFHDCHNISSQEIKLFLGSIIMKHSAQIKNHKWNIKQSTAATKQPFIFPSTKICDSFVDAETPLRILEFKTVDCERFLEDSLNIKLDENVMEFNEFNEKRIQSEKMNLIQQNVIDVHNDQMKIEEYIQTSRLEDLLKRNVFIFQPTTKDDGTTFKYPGGPPGFSKTHSMLKGDEFVRLSKEMSEIKKNFPSSNKNNGTFVSHGLYPTLYQFNHSCDPNLVFDVIRPGIIIARASRDINFGEEITISLGPNAKLASTKARQTFLQERNFEKCFCSECNADMDSYEHTHNFECKSCGFPIDTSLYYCNRCKHPQVPPIGLFAVKDFLTKYEKSETKDFNKEFNLHLSILRVLSTIYPVDGVYVYDQMFKILKLLVDENLPADSLILLKLMKDCSEKFYPEMSFPYFNEYLEIVKLVSEIISTNATDEFYARGSNATIIDELVLIAKSIVSKFDNSNSCKKNEFLFIYESYIKVEALKKNHKLKSCQKNLKKIINELDEPTIDYPAFEMGEIDQAISETYELVFGDFSTEKSSLSEDLFLSELSEESPVEEEKPKSVLFPISWYDMVEAEEKAMKMVDKSVVATPSSFEERRKFPLIFKDLELEDISPDEDSFNFKTPPIKNVRQSNNWRNRPNRDEEKRNSSNKKKSRKKNM